MMTTTAMIKKKFDSNDVFSQEGTPPHGAEKQNKSVDYIRKGKLLFEQSMEWALILSIFDSQIGLR